MSCTFGKQHVCCTYIENLGVKIGKETILENVNLHLHCGELTCIVGRNGAGKSTFMKALLNVIPHTGKIEFEGERCANCGQKEHEKEHKLYCSCTRAQKFITENPRFGYVPQSLQVEDGNPVSVEDLVLAALTKRPVWLRHRKKDVEFARNVLKTADAEGLLKRRVCELSGGELQRVMLSLAINPMPDILLLDEPVSGVDQVGLKNFYVLVDQLRREHDITILLISHDLDLVAEHADRVVFFNNAKALVGSVEEIFSCKEFTDIFGHSYLAQSKISKDGLAAKENPKNEIHQNEDLCAAGKNIHSHKKEEI